LIIPGPSSQILSSRVARITGKTLALCDYQQFPDGEGYIRIHDDIKGKDVTIIQSTPKDSDYISLLQLIDACDTAKSINVVIPYMGYARQDKRFKSGEPISARTMAKCIHADRVITINIHDESIMASFNAKAENLDATPLLGSYIKTHGLESPVFIAPDKSAFPLAKRAAENGVDGENGKSKYECDYLEKTRHSGDTVSIAPKDLDVAGRNVVIIDDMISTGGTMAITIELLKEQGVGKVYLACVHPILARNGVIRLYRAGVEEIIATDTLEKAVSVVSVASLIAKAI